jgi:hypothetical protein
MPVSYVETGISWTQERSLWKNIFSYKELQYKYNIFAKNNNAMKEKYNVNRISLCLLLTLACGTATAQEPLLKSEYSYRRYTTQDGMSDLITTSIFQDSKGFIWAGTIRGFCRFDGQQFKNFDSHGLSVIGFAEYNRHVIAIGVVSSLCVNENDSVKPLRMIHSKSGNIKMENFG